jgi:hypothetical protein
MYCNSNQRLWDKFLPQVMMAYRSSVNASTCSTPNKMVFGRDIILPLQACIGLPPQSNISNEPNKPTSDYILDLKDQLELIHEQAREVLKTKISYRKRHYDLTAKSRSLSVGDPVWLHDTSRRLGVCKKLSPTWKGPFLITKKVDDLVYLVKKSINLPAKAVHIDRLVKYKSNNIPKWFSTYLTNKPDKYQSCK